MNQFDVVEKITIKDWAKALVAGKSSPARALQEVGIIRGQWQASYFNWGRNALYAFFKQLPYKTIHFPAFTCPVLTEAATASDKKVELLEVDLATYNLDIKKLPKREPQCLVVVHTFGNPVDMGQIRKLYPHSFIIEDCAHALFAQIHGQFVGNQGDAVLFSLYKQVPNLNGALLLTKEKLNLQQKEESFTHFWPRIIFKTGGWHHFFINFLRKRYIDTLETREFSESFTPSQPVSKLFVIGLKKLSQEMAQRRQIGQWYKEATQENPYLLAQVPTEDSEPSFYQFVVRLKPEFIKVRDLVVRQLRRQNIFLDRLWYSAPITEKGFIQYQTSCHQALQLARSVISLPVNPQMIQRDVVTLVRLLTWQIKKNL